MQVPPSSHVEEADGTFQLVTLATVVNTTTVFGTAPPENVMVEFLFNIFVC